MRIDRIDNYQQKTYLHSSHEIIHGSINDHHHHYDDDDNIQEKDNEKGKFIVRLNLKKENIFIQFVLTEIRIKKQKRREF